MAGIYRTKQRDMVDAICRRYYGDESGYVEKVLAANPDLARLGPLPPAGTLIRLPDIPKAAAKVDVVKLWD